MQRYEHFAIIQINNLVIFSKSQLTPVNQAEILTENCFPKSKTIVKRNTHRFSHRVFPMGMTQMGKGKTFFDKCSTAVRDLFDNPSTVVRLGFDKPSTTLREKAKYLPNRNRTIRLLCPSQSRTTDKCLPNRVIGITMPLKGRAFPEGDFPVFRSAACRTLRPLLDHARCRFVADQVQQATIEFAPRVEPSPKPTPSAYQTNYGWIILTQPSAELSRETV